MYFSRWNRLLCLKLFFLVSIWNVKVDICALGHHKNHRKYTWKHCKFLIILFFKCIKMLSLCDYPYVQTWKILWQSLQCSHTQLSVLTLNREHLFKGRKWNYLAHANFKHIARQWLSMKHTSDNQPKWELQFHGGYYFWIG